MLMLGNSQLCGFKVDMLNYQAQFVQCFQVIPDVFLSLSQYVVLGWLREMCMYYNKIYDLLVLNHLIRSPDKM